MHFTLVPSKTMIFRYKLSMRRMIVVISIVVLDGDETCDSKVSRE